MTAIERSPVYAGTRTPLGKSSHTRTVFLFPHNSVLLIRSDLILSGIDSAGSSNSSQACEMSAFDTFSELRNTVDRWRPGCEHVAWAEGGQVYEMRRDKLNGRVEAVTVTSPPFGTNSETFFSKFGRVASSSCGGA
jgi:hypothetical protein